MFHRSTAPVASVTSMRTVVEMALPGFNWNEYPHVT